MCFSLGTEVSWPAHPGNSHVDKSTGEGMWKWALYGQNNRPALCQLQEELGIKTRWRSMEFISQRTAGKATTRSATYSQAIEVG